jgi:hypothetical protein
MKKRGLSNIIATVLIILLALLGAILVWVYIRSSITESSERVEMQEKCYTLDTELESCEYGGTKLDDYYFVSGLVKHKQGDPTNIRVAFYAEDGTSVTRDMQPIEILESKKILPPTAMKKLPVYAIASPIVYNRDETGNLVCPISKKINCNRIAIKGNLCEPPMSSGDIDDFTESLNNGSGIEHTPNCNWTNADFNCDGSTDWHDIGPFKMVLENGWIMCNKTMICEHAATHGHPPNGQGWYTNQSIIEYFNTTYCITIS